MNNETTKEVMNQKVAYDQLENLIMRCPRGLLVRLFEEYNGVVTPEAELTGIDEHISRLKDWAALGSKEAVMILAHVANNISDYLEFLAGKTKGTAQPAIVSDDDDPWLMSPYWSCERTLMAMRDAWLVLANTPHKELRRTLKKAANGSPSPLLPNATGMFKAAVMKQLDKLANEITYVADRKDSVEAKEHQEEYADDDEWEERCLLVDHILASLLSRRARSLGRAAVRQVLAEAKAWPLKLVASNFKNVESIEERTERIGLGSAIPYTVPKHRAGEEPIRHWVNSIFTHLNSERERMDTMSEQHRREYQAVEHAIRFGPEDAKPPLRDWNTSNHWLRKAALLPQPAMENLDQWVDAAMAYLYYFSTEVSYSTDVSKPLFEMQLKNGLSPVFPQSGGDLASATCDQHKGKDVRNESELNAQEDRLIRKWERSIGKRFDEFKWPEFVIKRTLSDGMPNERNAEGALKEKLKNGFSAILKPRRNLT